MGEYGLFYQNRSKTQEREEEEEEEEPYVHPDIRHTAPQHRWKTFFIKIIRHVGKLGFRQHMLFSIIISDSTLTMRALATGPRHRGSDNIRNSGLPEPLTTFISIR